MKLKDQKQKRLWEAQNKLWRDPSEIIAQTNGSDEVDPSLLKFKIKGQWWETLKKLKIQLLITREYEHLCMCLCSQNNSPSITYLPLPHPSGIAVNRKQKEIFIASTRNPNQIYKFKTSQGLMKRGDLNHFKHKANHKDKPLIAQQTSFFPGSLYIHDLAVIQNKLYANAVGHNAVIELKNDGTFQYVWWPKSVDFKNKPKFHLNVLQCNSIAPGKTIKSSYFSASTDIPLKYRPGHLKFPVDQRGVVFDGQSRDVICRGLTRPHSARIYKNKIWIDNSGYGELGYVQKNHFVPFVNLPGWTRGLCFYKDIAFVGTSRVIPKFHKYAPGLNAQKSICAIHAIDLKSKKVIGSLQWPYGNQIFAIDWIPQSWSSGFIYQFEPKKRTKHSQHYHYAYQLRS